MTITINMALVEEIQRLEKRIAGLEYQLEESQATDRRRQDENAALRHEIIALRESRDHYIALAGNNLAELRALQDRLANKNPYPDEYYNEN